MKSSILKKMSHEEMSPIQIPFIGICSIYKLTDSRSVLEVFGQFIPIVLP